MAKVLDSGFVELVDSMGNDLSIVRAARVSFGGDERDRTDEQERKLLRYLIRNRHTSPLEQVQFTFHVKAPIFVARQWMRHRTWSYNEISARYTELENEFYFPDPYRSQSKINKQASGLPLENQTSPWLAYGNAIEQATKSYEELLALGVSREQARAVLPVAIYTRFYATVDLHNLLHFISLRDDWHAQPEIQEYARALKDLAWTITPWAIEIYDEEHEDD